MNEKKRKRLVYASLVAAIIFALVMRPWEGRKRRPPTTGATTATTQSTPASHAVTAASSGQVVENTEVAEPLTIALATSWPADPFHQAAEGHLDQAGNPARGDFSHHEWNLQGILTVDNRPVCIFDGQTYETGGMINGWEIIYIGVNAVHLHHNGETVSLTLPQAGT